MSDYREVLAHQWLSFKNIEAKAVKSRREIEDALLDYVATKDEGSATTEFGRAKIKVTCRMNRKIDSDKLQSIAVDNGLQDALSNLFQWKPSIDMKRWTSADQSITTPLLDAITTTPGRPTFNITFEDE